MKNKSLPLLFSLLILFGTASSFAQGCFPQATYYSESFGLHPNGPLVPDCSEVNATKTFSTVTDTTILFTPLTQDIVYSIDAMRIVSVTGLPNGLELATDVMNSVTQESPYGTWLNGGNQFIGFESTIGCISISGNQADWNAASSGGTNNDGVFPVTILIDWRIAGTDIDISFIIPEGTWASESGGLVGVFQIVTELDVNGLSCSGFEVLPEVLSDNIATPSCDGSATTQVQGGSPPFSYSYSTGSSSQTVDGLCSGVYSVSVIDGQANQGTAQFAIAASENVYTQPGSLTPLDSLYSYLYTCSLDYNEPIDSFFVTAVEVLPWGDTLLVDWIVYQNGQPFTFSNVPYWTTLTPTDPMFVLVLYCVNGRSEPGIFQLNGFWNGSVGISDNSRPIKAKLYPNPGNELFNLQLEKSEPLTVRIMDVSGKVLRSEQLSGSTLYTLDMQDAPTGVYILELESDQGRTYKRLVKN